MPIYDNHPVYPHQEEMPYAQEPWKTFYVWQRLLSTVFLVPLWVIYYGILPRRYRPRASWSLRQIVIVKFYRRVYRVVEVAGVTWGTRDPCLEADNSKLSETRFQWISPLPDEFRTGVVDDEEVEFKRVGTFIWPRNPPPFSRIAAKPEPTMSADIDLESLAGAPEVIGIFMHGGGYTQMSAHEKAGTSRIPRRLIKDKVFTEIYAVEYRLLQHAPVPGALQDAAAVYAHIVINVLGATPSANGIYTYPTVPTDSHSSSGSSEHANEHEPLHTPYANTPKPTDFTGHPRRARNVKIVLIGDSAGGNLVLGLARWIRDEGALPEPDGLLLLSPSCDPSHAFPLTPSSYIPRPHEDTDYLVDTPEPRALLQRTFLGHHPLETIHSPYLSPASPRVLRAYGHRVDPAARGDHIGLGAIALAAESAVAIAGASAVAVANAAASVAKAERHPVAEVMANKTGNSTVPNADGTVSPTSTPAATPYSTPRLPDALAPRGFANGSDAMSFVSSAGGSTPFTTPRIPGPAVPKRLLELANDGSGQDRIGRSGPRPMLMSTMTFLNPRPRDPILRASLFGGFPRTFVTVGDAERLEHEIKSLVGAMEADGVDLHVEWAKDGVHDMLMLPAWDEKVREQVWAAIKNWVGSL